MILLQKVKVPWFFVKRLRLMTWPDLKESKQDRIKNLQKSAKLTWREIKTKSFKIKMPLIKAVILIGGPQKGTRFRPLSLDHPKPLFPVTNFSHWHYILTKLSKYSLKLFITEKRKSTSSFYFFHFFPGCRNTSCSTSYWSFGKGRWS